MFLRPARGLLDFAMALLCVWAAYFHTPLGAMVRKTFAVVAGVRSTARPVLAYYGGSTVSGGPSRFARTAAELGEDPTWTRALTLALVQVLEESPELTSQVAARHQVVRARLADPRRAKVELGRLLERQVRELGTDELAVVAILTSPEAARYARDRDRAEGGGGSVETLGRQLPPEFEGAVASAQRTLMLATAGGLSWPVHKRALLTSPYGMREHPVLGGPRMHHGVDIALPIGTSVRAAADGVVRRASHDAINGHMVVLDHGYGVSTAYCHNSKLLVVPGDRVARGQLVSRSGNSGRSTGPHLHYQVEMGGGAVDPLGLRRAAGSSSTRRPVGGARAAPRAPSET